MEALPYACQPQWTWWMNRMISTCSNKEPRKIKEITCTFPYVQPKSFRSKNLRFFWGRPRWTIIDFLLSVEGVLLLTNFIVYLTTTFSYYISLLILTFALRRRSCHLANNNVPIPTPKKVRLAGSKMERTDLNEKFCHFKNLDRRTKFSVGNKIDSVHNYQTTDSVLPYRNLGSLKS